MKKIICFMLALVMLMGLAACGKDAGTTVSESVESADLGALYESLSGNMPAMLVMEDDMRLNLLGIKAEDCAQVITAICSEGLKADEVWLIEAVDEAALERIEALAESRKTAKMDETSFYSPDQFAICEDGIIITEGLYLAFIVSPDAEAMENAFKEAVK